MKTKAEKAAYMKAWRAANKAHIADYNSRYKAAHSETIKPRKAVYDKAYYITNKGAMLTRAKSYAAKKPEVVRRAKEKWKKANPASVSANGRHRQCAKLQATPAWVDADEKFLIEEAYALAILRTKATGVKHHVDHIVPLRSKLVCGLHVPANLRVIPAAENVSKGNRFWPDMP